MIPSLETSAAEACHDGLAEAISASCSIYSNLERRIPASHLLRRINPIVMQVLADLREKLAPFYSDIGRPSIDPELMILTGSASRFRPHPMLSGRIS